MFTPPNIYPEKTYMTSQKTVDCHTFFTTRLIVFIFCVLLLPALIQNNILLLQDFIFMLC